MNFSTLKKSPYFEMLFLSLVSGLVYLPYIGNLSYLLDEWYFIYDGVVSGPNVFHAMFSVDRPARGYFFDAYFSLFGPNPLPYHIGAYLWRLFAGLCAFWLFRTLWPNNRRFVFLITLLFMLYPGYTWWVSAIEYQPHVASLALQVFSFAMTLEAIKSQRTVLRLLFSAGALLSGWAYIALVEYAVGMELFRFLCVYLLVLHLDDHVSTWQKGLASVRAWSWNILIPLGFLLWRSFFFENQRRTTDINLMLGEFQAKPSETLMEWTHNLGISLMNTGVYAWYKQVQLYLVAGEFQRRYMNEIILGIALLALLMVVLSRLSDSPSTGGSKSSKQISTEAIVLGFASLIVGILPVVFANRYINLSFYSHYSLPVSLAAAVLLAGIVSYFVTFRSLWNIILSLFVIVSGLSHSLLAQRTVALEDALQTFWWQASWRIPDLLPDSTIVTVYPYSQIVDNPLGLPEPANLIYFPEPQPQLPIRLPVSTLMPTEEHIESILTSAHKHSIQYRTHKSIINYSRILVLVQPTPQSCVRVIGGSQLMFSEQDPLSIHQIAGFSRMEVIRIHKAEHTPPIYAFGPEPQHDWCYFFEKADLGVQRGDWQDVARLGDDALTQGLTPHDIVEWFPFIQAYAMTGNQKKLAEIAVYTEAYPSFEHQICEAFQETNSALQPALEEREVVQKLFCEGIQ